MMPITNQPVYEGVFDREAFPVAEWINGNGFYIGCSQHLSQDDIDYVIEKFGEFFEKTGI